MALLWLACAFLAGIVAGGLWPFPVLACVVLALSLLAAALYQRTMRVAFPALLLALFVVGLARAHHPPGPPGPSDLGYYIGRTVQIDGEVVGEPDLRDTGGIFVVQAQRLHLSSRNFPISGRLQVRAPRVLVPDDGRLVTVRGKIEIAGKGDPGYRSSLTRQGIVAAMRYPRVFDNGAAPRGLLGWITPLREWLERGIDAWLPEPEAALLIAIALGAHSASLGTLAKPLIDTGLIHIIAISGIKIAIVAGTLHGFSRRIAGRFGAFALTLSTLWGYVLLTGATVSGVRSAIMWSLVFLAEVLGRSTVALLSLSVTIAVMVFFDPALPWDPAFLLTAIGTAAIVSFTNPISSRCRWLPSPFRESFSVTVAAQTGTLPVVVVGFHVVSLSGPLVNGLTLPFLPELIGGGLLLGVLSGIGSVSAPLSAMLYGLLHSGIVLITWLAQLPGTIPVNSLGVTLSISYYGILTTIAVRILKRSGWAPIGQMPHRSREFILALVTAASLVTISLQHADATAAPTLTRVGVGDALLLNADGRSILIGGSTQPLALAQAFAGVLPYGRHTLDAILVTDPREVAGLREVIRHYTVLEALDVGAEYPTREYAEWRADVRGRGIPVYALRTGTSLDLPSVHISAEAPDDALPKVDDSVAILRISTRRGSVLLLSAASQDEQQQVLVRGGLGRADRLIANSRDGVLPEFLREVGVREAWGTNPAAPQNLLP